MQMMGMMKYLIYCMLGFLAACSGNSKKYLSNTDTTEYITNVKVNGVINSATEYKTLTSILGKPDSTTKESSSASYFNHDEEEEYVCFKGLVYERYKDTVVFRSIDFTKSPKIYLLTDRLQLSYATMFNDLKKAYPKSFDRELIGTDMDKYATVSINTCNSGCDEKWILYFDSGREHLIRMDYWIDD